MCETSNDCIISSAFDSRDKKELKLTEEVCENGQKRFVKTDRRGL